LCTDPTCTQLYTLSLHDALPICQVRVDGTGAIADQQREVMHLARLAALQDEADLGARALADQVVMDAGDGEQSRDRGVVAVEGRSEEHTSELQSRVDLVCRLLLE